jgi:tetratricopeptide (TPR) repeat protein
VEAKVEPLRIGEIDPRCIAPTNEVPKLTPADSAKRTWKPDPSLWDVIKKRSLRAPAEIEITGFRDSLPVARGRVTLSTSLDPVGAPIFYRDVPLMPAEPEKGVIKPIAPKLLPYIAWRLRDVAEERSQVLMEGLHTCANCHSFSRDGKTLGLDLDGPHNDKGLYAIVSIGQKTTIRNEDVISWKKFRGETAKDKRIGFMSQISPDGRFVATTTQVQYFVANYKDYRFLQTFYPTRGIIAWYNRADGRMHALPGADDPGYVHANAVWSPDGEYLVFARATAREAYPEGRKLSEHANDPNEPEIQYDLYRIPFNQGRGGRAEIIPGASRNGMSNSFPKVSPDGRWIVFVQSRNGQLMRPDGQLYIVPAAGGVARRMRCNTPLMNSWHSFSPNGRWMVFSSKSRSPYTQLFLTHIDEDGNDSPAILIENTTAANRAANIPEFVNVPAGSFASIDAPAAEFYRLYAEAWDLTEKGQTEAAIRAWHKALTLSPEDDKANTNLGALLMSQGKLNDAITRFETALRANPEFTSARNNLGLVFLHQGNLDRAVKEWTLAVATDPRSVEARANLGNGFLMRGRFTDALAQWREALELEPYRLPILTNVAWMLATCPDSRVRNGREAVLVAERAREVADPGDPRALDVLAAAYAEAGRFKDAATTAREALRIAVRSNAAELAEALNARLSLYAKGKAFRDSP